MRGLYTFSAEDARRFAQHVGASTRQRNGELVFQKCPYCHAADKYTFSINMTTGQFECKRGSCGVKGNMITLSRDFDFSLGRDADAYYRTADYSKKQFKQFKDAHRQIETKDAAIEFLQNRGISPEITKKYELTVHKEQDNVLVFPFKDEEGNLTYVKYRDMNHTKESKTSKEWAEANCKPILFGMNHCNPEKNKTVVITEGQIDSLSCAEAGIENAVSVPTGKNGFTWIPYCWDWMSKFEKIVVFGDCENGQITLADELRRRWDVKVSVVRAEDYKDCKDANDILQKYGPEAVRFAVEHAEASFDKIKPLASVKWVDIMTMPMFKTNMKSIDEVLDGGLRFGQFAILTGKRGDGKSTFASQIGVEAISQDINSFFYSGELPDFYFRNWMDRQIAKKDKLTQSEIDKISQWYGEKAFIYDNTAVEDEEDDLLRTIEIAIVQKNCKFVLIDNLMTAMDFDGTTDFYQKQGAFCGKLAAMAKKYMAFILLIAHPRKANGQLTNDDVSGSSNITDRADLVFLYRRLDPKESTDDSLRKLEVMKNRLTGRLANGDHAIQLSFDAKSKGIAESMKDLLARNYGWTDENPYQEQPEDDFEIPYD